MIDEFILEMPEDCELSFYKVSGGAWVFKVDSNKPPYDTIILQRGVNRRLVIENAVKDIKKWLKASSESDKIPC